MSFPQHQFMEAKKKIDETTEPRLMFLCGFPLKQALKHETCATEFYKVYPE